MHSKKPILGYCYGAAIMSTLGVLDVCRPVHAPLGMDLSLYLEDPDRMQEQLLCIVRAIRGTLSSVAIPPGLGLHNEPAFQLAQGHLHPEGFVLVALLQICPMVLAKLLPRGTKVCGVPLRERKCVAWAAGKARSGTAGNGRTGTVHR